MTNHELAALRQLYTEWRGGHVLHPEHPAHREIADLLARNLLALIDAAEERDRLRSQRDALLASAEALFANKDYTEVRLAYETSFAGTDELADLQEIVRRISAAKEAT